MRWSQSPPRRISVNERSRLSLRKPARRNRSSRTSWGGAEASSPPTPHSGRSRRTGGTLSRLSSVARCRGARPTRQALSRPRQARRRAWHEQGVAALPVADITDPWLPRWAPTKQHGTGGSATEDMTMAGKRKRKSRASSGEDCPNPTSGGASMAASPSRSRTPTPTPVSS